ncbi:MAG: prenyltransferase/squalene oxidase repeat-containing protein [Pirellulales bacterium]
MAAGRIVQPVVLEGKSVLLQCPSCRGPMSVRLWLMEAECWQCGTRIEISESQAAFIEEMQRKERARSEVPASKEISRPTLSKPIKRSTIQLSPEPIIAPPTVEIEAPPIQWIRRNKGSIAKQLPRGMALAPAWLVSLRAASSSVVDLAILTTQHGDDRGIVLSLAIRPIRNQGDIDSFRMENTRAFDLPLPKQFNPNDPNDAGIIKASAELAEDLQDTNYERGYEPVPIREVLKHLHQPYDPKSSLMARDIRVRSEMLKVNGGTLLTEAAVARALRWIASHQRVDGAWRLDAFAYEPGRGEVSTKAGATALALLPFLGAGQTHRSGIYRENVRLGLDYLLALQGEDGDLRGGTEGEAGMYVHGQATIVLGEAYAMTRDRKLEEPLQKAIDFILGAQHRQGGWRYRPKMPGDTSVLGWQLMALQSAKMAGLQIPHSTFRKADAFLDSVSSNEGATYAYMPGHSHSPNMTAEALLCRLYLGTSRDDEGLRRGLRYLTREHPPSRDEVDYYYWYYATQALHHVGGPRWTKWNEALQEVLVEKQIKQGKHAGSWDVEGRLAEKGGRLYVTALATCTLEVYYRHLPLFESLEDQR